MRRLAAPIVALILAVVAVPAASTAAVADASPQTQRNTEKAEQLVTHANFNVPATEPAN
jgi:hypothetical protein